MNKELAEAILSDVGNAHDIGEKSGILVSQKEMDDTIVVVLHICFAWTSGHGETNAAEWRFYPDGRVLHVNCYPNEEVPVFGHETGFKFRHNERVTDADDIFSSFHSFIRETIGSFQTC